jgi:hypothetical protein
MAANRDPIGRRGALAVGAGLLLLLFAAAASAGDAKKAPGKPGVDHLRFSRTYGAALWEARLRNVPVLVSRHKDECGRCVRQYGGVLTQKSFIRWADANLVVMIAHNQLGHEQLETADAEGNVVRDCTLYPGMTCREHVDAAVDVDNAREEELVRVPFLTLCPNTWLVRPTGEVEQVSEEDQFVPSRVQAHVERVQKELGPALDRAAFTRLDEAFRRGDEALDAERWADALAAWAAVEGLVKRPHAALIAQVERRLAAVDQGVRWLFEDLAEPGPKDARTPAERLAAVDALIAAVERPVCGKRAPIEAEMRAWRASR